jgi:hypothetical protein
MFTIIPVASLTASTLKTVFAVEGANGLRGYSLFHESKKRPREDLI